MGVGVGFENFRAGPLQSLVWSIMVSFLGTLWGGLGPSLGLWLLMGLRDEVSYSRLRLLRAPRP